MGLLQLFSLVCVLQVTLAMPFDIIDFKAGHRGPWRFQEGRVDFHPHHTTSCSSTTSSSLPVSFSSSWPASTSCTDSLSASVTTIPSSSSINLPASTSSTTCTESLFPSSSALPTGIIPTAIPNPTGTGTPTPDKNPIDPREADLWSNKKRRSLEGPRHGHFPHYYPYHAGYGPYSSSAANGVTAGTGSVGSPTATGGGGTVTILPASSSSVGVPYYGN